MIIDDNKVDRYISSHILKKQPFAKEIMEFDMATKAITYLENNAKNSEALPQVILLDICMPEMDGFQFLERLSFLPDVIKQSCCILMLSSSLNVQDHERVEGNPVIKKFLNKPLQIGYLEEIESFYFGEVFAL